MLKRNPLISAILLISGTCVGAAMLALPIVNHSQGFMLSLPSLTLSWLLASLAGLVMLEANLWLKPGASLVSMADDTLGQSGKIGVWVAYSALLYMIMAALLTGLYDMLNVSVQALLQRSLPVLAGFSVLIIVFSAMIYAGARVIDLVNRLCMLGLLICFILLAILLVPQVKPSYWLLGSWQNFWQPLPMIITSFGYQIVIPSLRTYLGNDVKKLRLAVLIGTFIPLVAYIAWQMLIMGTLTPQDLHIILQTGQPATGIVERLSLRVSSNSLHHVIQWFGFFALLTTFMGVSLSLYDFLTDGLGLVQRRYTRLCTILIAFIPPGLIAICFPKGFITILAYASLFVIILLILIPCLMVYSGRYSRRYRHADGAVYRLIGGRPLLIGLILASIIAVCIEVLK